MRNLVLGMAILLGTAAVAEAQHYQRNRHYHQPRQHHYQPRYHHHHNHRQVSPWVYGLGALALGAGGAYYYYNQPRPYCERRIIGNYWNGYRWVPEVETVCY